MYTLSPIILVLFLITMLHPSFFSITEIRTYQSLPSMFSLSSNIKQLNPNSPLQHPNNYQNNKNYFHFPWQSPPASSIISGSNTFPSITTMIPFHVPFLSKKIYQMMCQHLASVLSLRALSNAVLYPHCR